MSKTTTTRKSKKTVRFNISESDGKPKKNLSLMAHNRFNEIYPKEGIIDSGATSHFLPMSYKGTNEKITTSGIKVGCANGSIMESKATDMLDLPSLPEEARSCHKLHEI